MMKTYHDVLDLLESQHVEVERLFAKLQSSRGDRIATFFELADRLAMQASIEETLIFPLVEDDEADLLRPSIEAHREIRRDLADMLALDPHDDAAEFDALLSLLQLRVSRHVRDDEALVLFPALRRALTDEQRHSLYAAASPMLEPAPVIAAA
ncbi:MAG TPA: hemerythrin domain-containing protein [Kofleriaceae bacterium]|nr:hemerythrin domain-containing protein [Kofleriaceae bacterium]